jgi:hypothetical protein
LALLQVSAPNFLEGRHGASMSTTSSAFEVVDDAAMTAFEKVWCRNLQQGQGGIAQKKMF